MLRVRGGGGGGGEGELLAYGKTDINNIKKSARHHFYSWQLFSFFFGCARICSRHFLPLARLPLFPGCACLPPLFFLKAPLLLKL